MPEKVKFKPGDGFVVQAPADKPHEEVRTEVEAVHGLKMHISVKIGPWQQEGGVRFICPIVAIDDPHLSLNIDNWPSENCYILLGRFK